MLRNIKFVIQFVIHLYVIFQLINTNAADETGPNTKIYKGLSAVDHQYLKHMVIVKAGNLYCGGAILNPKVILTAAHCVTKNESKSLIAKFVSKAHVCAGTPEFICNSKTRQISSVQNAFVHSLYHRPADGHDIAIIFLKKALVEDGKTVQRIELANHEPSVGTTCTSIGWGPTQCSDSNAVLPKEAQYTLLTRISSRHCNQAGYLRATLCFADMNETSGNCQEDSGGALICDGKTAGIMSLEKEITKVFFSEYTSVFIYRKWIKKIIKKNDYKLRSVSVRSRAADLFIIFVTSLFAVVHYRFYF